MQVPLPRGVWLVKMTAAYAAAMQEANKTKKRQAADPSQDWTGVLVRFLKDQLNEINGLLHNTSSSSASATLLPGVVQGE